MDRAHVMARDEAGDFRLLGVYGSFPSDLDTELKALGRRLGKFKKLDSATYEREREFVYQFLMELYGFPIASERRTSGALFARRLSRLKEQYLIKVLGASDRTITSLSRVRAEAVSPGGKDRPDLAVAGAGGGQPPSQRQAAFTWTPGGGW